MARLMAKMPVQVQKTCSCSCPSLHGPSVAPCSHHTMLEQAPPNLFPVQLSKACLRAQNCGVGAEICLRKVK